MKQIGIGVAVLTGIAALAAVYIVGLPVNVTSRSPKSAPASSIPRGIGFDFYVLALSWSPTYCRDSQARKRDAVQCAGPRPFAFVVHGLWPQFETGYPRSCQTAQRRPSAQLAQNMLDMMPSERLVQHQWDNHGACSGLSAPDYFAVTRFAAQAIAIPDAYASAPDWRSVTASDVEAAFIAANPGLREDGIAVTKRGNNLSEVRVCLTPDLAPRSCLEVDQDGVGGQTRLSMPPSRD